MPKLYYPEEILESKFENNKTLFLVKWKGYSDTTWEPEENIAHRVDLIENYHDMVMMENMNFKTGGYIYCRVSSKEQSMYNNGHTSLEVQEQTCRKYCEENNINVIKVVKEVYSAKNMNKLAGLHYLCNIASHGQTIYVYDISRFSRNTHHALNLLEELRQSSISVHSVTENISYSNPASRNHFRLQLCSANHFSDICSEKIKASIKFRRERGDYIGSTRFGYKTVVDEKTNIRTKVPNENEMKIINMVCTHKLQSPYDIAEDLRKKGIMFRKRVPTERNVLNIIINNLKHKLSSKKYNKIKKNSKIRSSPY